MSAGHPLSPHAYPAKRRPGSGNASSFDILANSGDGNCFNNSLSQALLRSPRSLRRELSLAALGSPLASAADVRRIATAECWATEADLGLARALLPAVAQRGLLLYLEPEGQWLQFLGDATCVPITPAAVLHTHAPHSPVSPICVHYTDAPGHFELMQFREDALCRAAVTGEHTPLPRRQDMSVNESSAIHPHCGHTHGLASLPADCLCRVFTSSFILPGALSWLALSKDLRQIALDCNCLQSVSSEQLANCACSGRLCVNQALRALADHRLPWAGRLLLDAAAPAAVRPFAGSWQAQNNFESRLALFSGQIAPSPVMSFCVELEPSHQTCILFLGACSTSDIHGLAQQLTASRQQQSPYSYWGVALLVEEGFCTHAEWVSADGGSLEGSSFGARALDFRHQQTLTLLLCKERLALFNGRNEQLTHVPLNHLHRRHRGAWRIQPAQAHQAYAIVAHESISRQAEDAGSFIFPCPTVTREAVSFSRHGTAASKVLDERVVCGGAGFVSLPCAVQELVLQFLLSCSSLSRHACLCRSTLDVCRYAVRPPGLSLLLFACSCVGLCTNRALIALLKQGYPSDLLMYSSCFGCSWGWLSFVVLWLSGRAGQPVKIETAMTTMTLSSSLSWMFFILTFNRGWLSFVVLWLSVRAGQPVKIKTPKMRMTLSSSLSWMFFILTYNRGVGLVLSFCGCQYGRVCLLKSKPQ